MKVIFFFIFLSLTLISCKKEKISCWHCVDSEGYVMPDICNKTESDIRNEHPGYTCDRL